MELAAPIRPDGGSHAVGLGVVVAVHLVIGYALITGLAQKVIDAVKEPIEARLIEEEIKKPPPPPPPEPVKPTPKLVVPPPFVPPPEVQVATQPPAPTISAVTPVPPAAVEPHPAPPPAPPPPAPRAEPVAIGVACPTMVAPVAPRRAQQEGIGGKVRAQATIRDGKVVDVQILSSTPRGLFDAAVRTAMLQYGCQTTGTPEIVAIQSFEFRAAD